MSNPSLIFFSVSFEYLSIVYSITIVASAFRLTPFYANCLINNPVYPSPCLVHCDFQKSLISKVPHNIL